MKTFKTVAFDDQKIGDGFQIRPMLVSNSITGDPVDISDVQIIATFRYNSSRGRILHKATSDDGITMGPEANKYTIDTWQLDVPEGKIYCDVSFIFPNELPRTYLAFFFNAVSNTNSPFLTEPTS
jgi:hypothetical protein